MDINGISSGAISLNMKEKAGDTISTAVASKALDIQVDAAATLISSASKSAATEAHLGNKIDVHA